MFDDGEGFLTIVDPADDYTQQPVILVNHSEWWLMIVDQLGYGNRHGW